MGVGADDRGTGTDDVDDRDPDVLLDRLRLAREDAARSERRWRTLLHSATERVTVLAADGTVLLSTSDGENMGYEPWSAENMAEILFQRLHPDDLAMALDRFGALVGTRGPSEPWLMRLRDAEDRWLWVEVRPDNQLDNPDVAGIVVTTRDVTEREEAMARLREESRSLETLHAMGRRLAAELDLDVLLQAVSDAGTAVTDAAFGCFFHRTGEGSSTFAVTGAPRERVAGFPTRAAGVFSRTFDAGQVVRVGDVERHPAFPAGAPNPLGVRSFLGVPVCSSRGDLLGGLFFGHPEPDVFTERGERLALGIAAHAAIALDNAQLYQAAQREIAARREAEAELVHQAHHDPLTGLPNRVLLEDRLTQALAHFDRDARAVAVLLLDLDRFKVVNDSLGHAAGDHIIEAVAQRLREVVRPGDTVARLGGDEFVLVCAGLNGELDAVGVADRIASAFLAPFQLGDHRMQITASVGIAMARESSTDPATLLRDADAVMYRAKSRGGGRWEIFDATVRERVVHRLRVENDLRRALDADELVLYVQPVVSLRTGEVVGAEGLARWHHPDRGVVMPSEFIPVAEESGLVVPLGEQMLELGCRQLAAWAEQETTANHVLSVNVSARQLVQADVVRSVRRALAITGTDARQLSLEITETALMEDVTAVSRVLRHLRSLGVQLWVDDFGTGYSSLIYLRRLPIDGLKIDRSFVAGVADEDEDRVIVTSIVNLAHSLGLVALAEGVETEAQAGQLRAMGCDLAQGHLWSRPHAPPRSISAAW